MDARIKNKIVLPDVIVSLIWKRVYSKNVVANIHSHADKINKNNSPITIFARNYNILRIMSGMKGLSYST